MSNVFEFFAKIGNYIIFAFILAGLFALYLLGKKIYSLLSKEHSTRFSKVVSIVLCVTIGVVSLFSLFCSNYYSRYHSDDIYVLYYDKSITAGETMHIVIKANPDTAYDIEFEGSTCKSTVERSNGAGYASYTFKTDKSADKGEDFFHIYNYDDSDITTDYYYFTVE